MTSFSLGNRPATRRNWRTAPLWLLLVGALSFPGRGGEVGELIFFDGFETFIDQTIVAGETLTLDLTVLPPQGDYGDVTYSVEPLPLPPNATLDGPTFIFAPTAEQAGAFEFMFMAENDMGDMRSGAVEITVLEPPEDGTTAISGRLLDSIALSQGDEVPIVGATVQILGGSASTTTDAQGNFHLDDIAGTEVVLDVETDTADFAPDGSGYASFRTPLSLVANVTNPIGDPILLPRIDPDGTAMVDPGSNTVVENPDLGVSIEIPAGTAENEGGGDFSGEMSISEVPADMPPMQLPRELQPGMLITIQPTGVNFTQPVPITFPNIDNLPPGFETNLWSLSETGVFTVTGRGKVSADGDRIETVSGGVWAATWHAPVPEPPEINDDTDDNNAEEDIDSPDEEAQCQVGSSASLRGGCLRIRHRLPVHQSLGTERSLELLYRSTNAYPNPIININSSLSTTTATPNAFDIELINVAGVDQDFRAVVEPLRDSQRHAFTFDASAFPTGRYPYDLMIAGQYDRSFVGARDFGNVLVNNQIQSPFGAGWQMTGISRLVDTEGDLLLQTKDGGLKRFAGDLFAPARVFPADRVPRSITSADFNGDGAIDLATANGGSDDTSVLLGNGDGSFQDQQRFAAGHGPGSITAVDFNGDGAIDLATANAGPDDTSVLLGNGDGTFQGQRRFAAGDAPVSITAADFNGDGATDLATANFGSDDTSVLLGNGDGTFQGQQRFAAGSGLYSITAANFNGDGLPDLAAVNLHANDISVLLNQPVPDVLAGPASDFTTIERQSDGAFIRFFNEGSQVHFDAEGLQTSSVDPNGNTTSFAYDGQQRLVSITDPAGKVTQLRYTGQRLSEIENPAGRITRFTHDATGNLTRITNPDESTREFSYDDHHLLTRQTDERGMVTEYTYDATGRLIMSRQPDGSERMLAASRTQALVADPESTSVDNPAPAVPAGDVESGFINGDGTIQTFESDSHGKITRRTDAAGLMTTIERDADGNPVTTTFPDGTVISATFDNRGNLTSFSDNVRGGTRTLEYQQAFNRLTRITDSQGNTTKLDYDERGNLTGLTSPTDRNLAFTHNARGLTETSTDALGTQRQFEYNEAGNLVRLTEGTSTARRTTDITYTGEGLPATLTNAEGQQSGFEYDVEGRLTRLALPDGRAIAIAYDDAGNPIAITPPGRPEHRFSFNEVNLETAYDPPAIGLSDDITRMEYNNARQLTGIVRPDGKRVEFGYDSTGRLQDRTMPAGATTLGYDADTGQLISVDTADIDLDFQWDGFLPVSASASGDIDGQVSQDFDSDFFLISEAVNGDAVSFEYDRDGLLIQAGALNLTRESASGLLGSTTLGVVSVSIDYNAFAEPRTRQIEVNDNPVLGFGFTRDKLGRIEQLTETLGGSTVALDYRYDLAGRLIEVRQNDTPIETYTYDANSNRIQSTTAAGTIDYDYDDQDRLIEATGPAGTTTYEYTDAGELEAKTAPAGTTTYNYDAAGNLREVTLPDGTVIEYLIDGLDRRVGKRVNGELVKGWLYRGLLNPVAELDAQGNVVTRFVYGERPNVPAYMIRDGKTYRIVSDHLGSPRLLIDTDTGEVVQQMAYDTFGRVIEDTNPGFQPFGFAGGLYDPDTGLVRFGARDYDPETGRWTAKDPIRFAGGDPNLYGYVLNDPVNLVDPYGLLGGPFGPLNRRGINTRTAIEVSRHSNALALAGTIAAVGGTAGTTAAARGGALVCRAVSSAAASSRGREALKTACLAASLCTIQINSAGNIVIKPTRAVLQQRRRLQKIRAGIQREQVNRFREVIRDR